MSKLLTVLFLTHNYPRFSGDSSGVFLSVLARKLLEHNIRTVVLAPHDAGTAEQEVLDGISVHRFRYHEDESRQTLAYRGNMQKQVFSPVGLWRLRKFLKSFEEAAADLIDEKPIEVVVGHWLIPAGIVMRSLMKKTDLPMVVSSHGSDIRLLRKSRALVLPYLQPLLRSIYRWTTVSSYLRNEAIRMAPSVAEKVEILPLPNDETVFYPDPAITREEKLVVAVTRFSAQKRIMPLLRAFEMVVRRFPEARLELYGRGELQKEVEHFIERHNLREAVRINAPVPQQALRKVYNRAAVVVLNSIDEGFGLALTEAMLCGAPVIGTRSGGIVDIIQGDQTGLLVEPDNVAALAEAMILLFSDDAVRERLARNGKAAADGHFASGPLAGRFADLLRGAAQSRS